MAPEEGVNLVFALKQKNVDVLEELFWKASDPESPDYGSHLSLEEISDLVRPSDETVKVC